jgi:hypothetical protein
MNILDIVFKYKSKINEYYIYYDDDKVIIVFYLYNIIKKYLEDKTQFNNLDFNKLLNEITNIYGIFHNIGLNITPIFTNTRKLYVKIDSNYTSNKLIPFIIYCLPILCSRQNLKLELLNIYHPILKFKDIVLYDINELYLNIFYIGYKDNKEETISYETYLKFEKKQKYKILKRKKFLEKIYKLIPFVIIQKNIIPFI